MILRDNSDAEIDAFFDVCNRLGGFDAHIDPEWADGYLTALAAGPRTVSLDELLPKMAGDAFDRAFADPAAVEQARAALLARMRVLANHLDPEALIVVPDELRLMPQVAIGPAQEGEPGSTQGDVPDLAPAGMFWAQGYLDALDDFVDEWFAAAGASEAQIREHDEILQDIRWLTREDNDPQLQAHLLANSKDALATREDLIDQACWAAQDLRLWWLDHAPRPVTRHVPPKPGRNDPCPCGSGLKFKKCHGQ